ncbi:hypothetical protein CC1G_15210 [Coprinopsis cinerea okayama7|uniref:Uncharacterized protein n=1 Tax=Coprinopsis cinerea (strain Okayama-7 / 130 / ATCC MYA-4618 / FGSC 9003) TaxID=240176 RepID=D6RPJ5_COPC7|nr:hypothetical protein CC1G_15210 [Coprinopsis cinerea okayama7\|eukprot:XP_002910575.1 hypothetical protein CC1G_15210 [Coprinopsis cinerea okayama7\
MTPQAPRPPHPPRRLSFPDDLVVRGGGGKLPPSRYLVKFPGGYKNDDPGLNVNLYDPEVWYGQGS